MCACFFSCLRVDFGHVFPFVKVSFCGWVDSVDIVIIRHWTTNIRLYNMDLLFFSKKESSKVKIVLGCLIPHIYGRKTRLCSFLYLSSTKCAFNRQIQIRFIFLHFVYAPTTTRCSIAPWASYRGVLFSEGSNSVSEN